MSREFISIGDITIYWYSIIIMIAVLTSIFFVLKESKKQGISLFMNDLITYIIIFGIIGARVYYVIFNFSSYKNDLISIFEIWNGGIAIYGGIIGGLLTIIYYSKKEHQSILKVTDIIAPYLLLSQAIGRWGNFFNQEAHGTIVEKVVLENLHLPEFIIEGMYINGNYYHPTFFYESLWCFLGFIILIILKKNFAGKHKGVLTYSYFLWYGIGRLFIEGMRTDSLYIGNIRVSQLLSFILIIIDTVALVIHFIKYYQQSKYKKET